MHATHSRPSSKIALACLLQLHSCAQCAKRNSDSCADASKWEPLLMRMSLCLAGPASSSFRRKRWVQGARLYTLPEKLQFCSKQLVITEDAAASLSECQVKEGVQESEGNTRSMKFSACSGVDGRQWKVPYQLSAVFSYRSGCPVLPLWSSD